jgi:hypothetical protein
MSRNRVSISLSRATLTLGLSLSSCTVWRAAPAALSAPIPERRAVQVWSGGHSLSAHGVVVRGDSVRAVPRWKPPDCDSCAVYYARTAIDSVRLRAPAPIQTVGLVGAFLALVYFTMRLQGLGGPGS